MIPTKGWSAVLSVDDLRVHEYVVFRGMFTIKRHDLKTVRIQVESYSEVIYDWLIIILQGRSHFS